MAKAKKEKKEKKEKKGKGGKKKLLIPLIGLVVIAAAAFAVIRFVLPKLGGGDGTEKPPKNLEAYTIGEDSTVALDTILEEGEGELLVNRGPGKTKTKKEDSSEEIIEEKYTYIYEVIGAANVMNRYLDILLGEEGFSLVDETYLIQDERPELEDAEGALILARNSVVEGHVFQLVIGWSEASANLAIRVSSPEGQLRKPEKKEPPKPASVGEQMAKIQAMTPSDLALPGTSMSEYDVYPIEGFVNIDGLDCRRFHIYEAGDSYTLKGIIFLSGDQQHVYRMDPEDNSIITELK